MSQVDTRALSLSPLSPFEIDKSQCDRKQIEKPLHKSKSLFVSSPSKRDNTNELLMNIHLEHWQPVTSAIVRESAPLILRVVFCHSRHLDKR